MLKDRLDLIIKELGLSGRQFEKECGLPSGSYSSMPICRLHFNTGNKYLETFDAEKNGTKHLLESLDDIYKYRTEIVAACKMY